MGKAAGEETWDSVFSLMVYHSLTQGIGRSCHQLPPDCLISMKQVTDTKAWSPVATNNSCR